MFINNYKNFSSFSMGDDKFVSPAIIILMLSIRGTIFQEILDNILNLCITLSTWTLAMQFYEFFGNHLCLIAFWLFLNGGLIREMKFWSHISSIRKPLSNIMLSLIDINSWIDPFCWYSSPYPLRKTDAKSAAVTAIKYLTVLFFL